MLWGCKVDELVAPVNYDSIFRIVKEKNRPRDVFGVSSHSYPLPLFRLRETGSYAQPNYNIVFYWNQWGLMEVAGTKFDNTKEGSLCVDQSFGGFLSLFYCL